MLCVIAVCMVRDLYSCVEAVRTSTIVVYLVRVHVAGLGCNVYKLG